MTFTKKTLIAATFLMGLGIALTSATPSMAQTPDVPSVERHYGGGHGGSHWGGGWGGNHGRCQWTGGGRCPWGC